MNKNRRNIINKAVNKINEAKDILSDVLMEEEASFENLPENLQYSIKGEQSEEAIDCLTDSIEELETIALQLQEL